MEFRNSSKTAAKLTFLAVAFALVAPACGAARAALARETCKPVKVVKVNNGNRVQSGRAVGDFWEVEIALNGKVTLSDISSLPRAAGGDLEVLDEGKRVRGQFAAGGVEALVEAGAEITMLRKFVLVEGGTSQSDSLDGGVSVLGTCSGTYFYGESWYNVYIESSWPAYYGSGIDFSAAPGGHTVTCIDVHYEVRDLSWSSLVDVELSDEDYFASNYTLVSGWWGYYGDIVETQTGITAFNGKDLSQAWILWATDIYADGWGYIDYWWIKLYYEEGPDYCDASGGCDEYISDVVVGTINNTNTGCVNGYEDYTSMSTTMEIGTGYVITVVNGNPYDEDKCGVWVDWNQDLDFNDPGETISMSGSPGGGPYTATITPPADANLGETRMRVRIMWGGADGGNPLEPCGTTGYGEVEDYTITVAAEPSYCDALGSCSYGFISDVVVGSINNTDNGCGDGYSDYTSLSTRVWIGSGCPVTVVNGDPYAEDLCGIWVDWNQDKDFDDPCESIPVSGSPGMGPYSGTITPTADAKVGDTGMRIRIMYFDDAGPCGNAYGEVEDYTITVMAETSLRADFVDPNGVDMSDFAVLAGQWGQAPGEPSADIAPGCGDGTVDWFDLRALVEDWLEGTNP